MAKLGRFTKQPGEVQDYDISFVDFLAKFSDTGSALSVSADAGIVVGATSLIGGIVKVWLSGGTHGKDYKITVVVTTTGGRIKEDEFIIKVRET